MQSVYGEILCAPPRQRHVTVLPSLSDRLDIKNFDFGTTHFDTVVQRRLGDA